MNAERKAVLLRFTRLAVHLARAGKITEDDVTALIADGIEILGDGGEPVNIHINGPGGNFTVTDAKTLRQQRNGAAGAGASAEETPHVEEK